MIRFYQLHRSVLHNINRIGIGTLQFLTCGNGNIFRIVTIDKGDVLVNCVYSALAPLGTGCLLIGRQNMDAAVQAVQIPGLTGADVLVVFLCHHR